MKLVYHDNKHSYYLDGKRCKGVTTVAKIPTDTWNLERYSERNVAIGMTLEPKLIEDVACHIENKDRLNTIVDDAKRAAKSLHKADRGTQMHRVLELILLGQEIKLLTDQQRRDAEVLKRTLDRYKLTPHMNLTEQFVCWPQHLVAGRFDAVLERPDGALWLVDLKSGPNAIAYPQSTACQLALYARAPHVSVDAPAFGDRQTIENWRTMPEKLDYKWARVLLCEPDATVGTMHRIDIEHGWAGARKALELVNWRKADNTDIVMDEIAEDDTSTDYVVFSGEQRYISWVPSATTVEALYQLWTQAKAEGVSGPMLQAACAARKAELLAIPAAV